MTGSTFGAFAAFAAVAAILVLTPGVGTAYLTSTVIAHGKRPGYLSALGMLLGGVIHALAAALGTALLLRAFPGALSWIAIAGGGFILWLGLRGIARALRPPPVDRRLSSPPGRHAFVTTGIFVALANAPLPLFYLVVVPQYIPREMPRLGGALLLSFLHLMMAGTWMVTLVALIGRLVDVLRRPRVLLTMQLLTGFALVALGATSISGAL